MQKTKMKVRRGSVLTPVVIGLGVSMAVTVLFVCIGALFISNEYLKPEASFYVSVFTWFIASFVGAVTSGKMAGENMLPACVIAGVSYFTALIALALLFFEGINSGVIGGIIAVSAGISGGIVLCLKVKSPSGRRRRRSATR